jgi:uncharacterized protein YkwD
MKKTLASIMTAAALTLGVVVAVPAEASTSPGLDDKRAALLKLHNDARKSKCGADSLKMSSGANSSALYHAKDMVDENYFAHNSQDPFEYWYKRIDRFVLYQVGGENVASGQTDAYDVFYGESSTAKSWWNSDTHRRNIMDCSFKWVGFGYATDISGDRKWVADFVYGSGSGF